MNDLTITNIPMSDIHADEEFNCRGVIAAIDVVDLAKDIADKGLIQPVVVSPYPEERQKETGFKYLLIAGYRRHMAHRVLKATEISAIVRDDMQDEAQARYFNLSENLQRKDLTILQEAKALQKLKDLGISEVDTAEHLGASRGWVQVRYMLLELPEEVQAEVEAGFITQSQIRDLFSIQRVGTQEDVFDAVRTLKDAKIKGRKNADIAVKAPKTMKKHRKRGEINEMLEHCQEYLHNGFWARCMAWCSGEISTKDFEDSAKEFAQSQDKVYVNAE